EYCSSHDAVRGEWLRNEPGHDIPQRSFAASWRCRPQGEPRKNPERLECVCRHAPESHRIRRRVAQDYKAFDCGCDGIKQLTAIHSLMPWLELRQLEWPTLALYAPIRRPCRLHQRIQRANPAA